LINFAVSLLLVLISFLLLLKKVLAFVFTYIIFLPLRFILRIIFYKVIVRIYGWYFFIIKKLGWQRARHNPVVFLFKQKFVHILVVSMTALLLFINLSYRTSAENMPINPARTILADLISNEFNAPGYDDQQLIVETFNQEQTISAIQQSYLDNLSAFRPQTTASMSGEEEGGEIKTIQEGGSMVKPDIATTKISKRPRTETTTYVVEKGDTISTIAEKFEISVSTILWENNLSVYSLIRPGDKLRILPMSGLNHQVAKGDTLASIAKKYDIEENKIIEANKIADGSKLAVGDKLFIPGGKKISTPVAQPTRYTGISTIVDLVKDPGAAPVSGNKMNWPAGVRKITQYFSWRHTGLDIAGPLGTPIYAADSGTVEIEGWGSGYSNQIVINHGGGKKTRYAHLSKFYVEKGEAVTKGQAIAAMGSTGWSTGSHLHFEVIINGTKYNPLNYIK